MNTPIAVAIEPRRPFWAKCADCGHCWPVAYAPMELAKFAKVIGRAICPKCGASGKRVLVGGQDNGVLDESGQEGALS